MGGKLAGYLAALLLIGMGAILGLPKLASAIINVFASTSSVLGRIH